MEDIVADDFTRKVNLFCVYKGYRLKDKKRLSELMWNLIWDVSLLIFSPWCVVGNGSNIVEKIDLGYFQKRKTNIGYFHFLSTCTISAGLSHCWVCFQHSPYPLHVSAHFIIVKNTTSSCFWGIIYGCCLFRSPNIGSKTKLSYFLWYCINMFSSL